jgi:hypothetical protein
MRPSVINRARDFKRFPIRLVDDHYVFDIGFRLRAVTIRRDVVVIAICGSAADLGIVGSRHFAPERKLVELSPMHSTSRLGKRRKQKNAGGRS